MFLFLYGRNTHASKLESLIYLNNLSDDINIIENNESFITIESNLANSDLNIDELAGTLKIAHVIKKLTEGELYSIEEYLSEINIYNEKFNYAISYKDVAEEIRPFIEDSVKSYLKQNKFRVLKKSPRRGSIISPSEYFTFKLESGIELIIVGGKDGYYLCQTLQSTNPEIYKERDEERPSRVFTHGTSPRTAQLMLNILNPDTNDVIVDPFCGTGTFMIECVVKHIKCIGIDKEQELVNSAIKNTKWAKKRYGESTKTDFVCGDSRFIEFSADLAIFEPYMGPFLNKTPTNRQAVRIIDELERIYTGVFRNLAKNLMKGKVICILPSFNTIEGQEIRLNHKVYEDFGFKLAQLPLDIYNPMPYKAVDESIINRKIYLLTK